MPAATSSGRLRQKKIKDYLIIPSYPRKPKGWIQDGPFPSECHGHSFKSIQDLPNELLLLILEHIYTQIPLSNHARKLSLVCKRFHYVYGPPALEFLRLDGVTNVRNFTKLALDSARFSLLAVRIAVISYKACNEITKLATLEQLVPMVRKFSGLATVVLTCVVVNCELLEAFGTLPHLTSLTYDTPHPYDALERIMWYGHFEARYLKSRLHLLPRNLKNLSFKLSCADSEKKAIKFLLSVLSASQESLISLTVNLQSMLGEAWLRDLYKMHFPSLSSVAIYYANPDDWADFSVFYSRHTLHLRNVEILLYIDSTARDDFAWMSELPGLKDEANWDDMEGAAALMRNCKEQQKPSDEEETSNLVMEELALQGCPWATLKIIGKVHPAIRVLNAWELFAVDVEADEDDSDYDLENDCDLRPPIEELRLAAPYFLKLEVLRFNTDHQGLHLHSISKPFPFCRSCNSSICTAAHAELSLSRSFANSDDPVQSVHEWEEMEWPTYRETVYELANLFPKLRLVEWFLIPFDLSEKSNVFAPFWSWKIQRSEQSMGRPTISRSLHDATVRPFDPIPDWNLTKGFSVPPNKEIVA